MARTLKAKKRKIAPVRGAKDETGLVLVGTYKAGQLKWIGRHGLYNYPAKEGDAFDAAAMGAVGELWLYADAKGTRHCYAAEYVGKMTREEWLKENPTYPKGKVKGEGQEEHKAYYVFRTRPQEYGALRDGQFVVARADDFGRGRGQTQKIKAALERYRADGEFAPLAAYLPQDLAQVPKEQLRVCEPWVQMDFMGRFEEERKSHDLDVALNVAAEARAEGKLTCVEICAGAGGQAIGLGKKGNCRQMGHVDWTFVAMNLFRRGHVNLSAADIKRDRIYSTWYGDVANTGVAKCVCQDENKVTFCATGSSDRYFEVEYMAEWDVPRREFAAADDIISLPDERLSIDRLMNFRVGTTDDV